MKPTVLKINKETINGETYIETMPSFLSRVRKLDKESQEATFRDYLDSQRKAVFDLEEKRVQERLKK